MSESELVKSPSKINVIIEYRLPMPMNLEEYRRAQLYTTAKSSWQTTMLSTGSGGSAGVVVKENNIYKGVSPNVTAHGRLKEREELSKDESIHTVKEIHFGNNLPRIVNAILPKDAKFVEERCWNAFPYVLTLYTSKQSYLSSRLFISVESMHYENDTGDQENVFQLTGKELSQRKVMTMDIANDFVGDMPDIILDSESGSESPASPASPSPAKSGATPPVGDPRGYKSKLTGRGPLRGKDWPGNTTPVMTAYKLVRMVCDVPLHSKVEKAVLKSAIYDMVLNAHKAMFCNTDEWCWLDTETIRCVV